METALDHLERLKSEFAFIESIYYCRQFKEIKYWIRGDMKHWATIRIDNVGLDNLIKVCSHELDDGTHLEQRLSIDDV